jgi:hypothetical protein
LTIEVHQFIRHKSEDEVSLLGEFDKNGLAEGAFPAGGKGIGQLFGGEIDILHDRDVRKKAVSPADQSTAKDIGGNDPEEIEQEKEADDSKTGDGNLPVKEPMGDERHQRVEDAVEDVKDEFQNEEGNAEGQDDQNACKDFGPKVF